MKIERAKLGNYLGHVCLEQMLAGLQETFGPEITAAPVRRAGEQLGDDIAQDWNLRADLITPERLPLLLEAAMGEQGHNLARIHEVTLSEQGVQVTATWPNAPLIRELALGTLHGLLSHLLGLQLERPQPSSKAGIYSEGRSEDTCGVLLMRRALLQAS